MNDMINREGGETPDSAPEPLLASASAPAAEQAGERRRRAKPPLPTEEGSLAALNALSGMTLMGLVGVPQANAIRGIHATILQHLGRKQGGPEPLRLDEPGLAAIVAKHPELASQLEPLLSDEQIDALMRRASADEGSDA